MTGEFTSSSNWERLLHTFTVQKQAFLRNPFPTYDQRRHKLQALRRQLKRYQDVLALAIANDFGWRAPAESKLVDVMAPVFEISHALHGLRKWMRPSRRSTELLFLTNSICVTYQPKGVVGIVVPWNFPVYLAVGPLTAALAAGNRVLIKMSELTPFTCQALKQLLGDVFPESEVAVVGGELEDPAAFSSLPFDHLVFTGSTSTGRKVMRAAAENLTPVTLELGGKSPAVVTRSYSLTDAAARIAHGKTFNCGQVCIAPDYAFVPTESVEAFAAAVEAAFLSMYGHAESNADYTAVVNKVHARRLQRLLDDAHGKGARIRSCGTAGAGRQMPLHIVTGVTADMALMKEEIFGPILPVMSYDTLDEVVSFITGNPRPLALYCFGHEAGERERLLRQTHSGGVSINDWGWHAMNHDAPFGGIGNSGMGSYHGIEGFRELSHAKTVFKRHRFYPIGLFYPPYGTWVQKLILRFFIGEADVGVKLAPVLSSSVPTTTQTGESTNA